IPSLDTLRNIVIDRSTKRTPKWRFRLPSPDVPGDALDFIVQVQPKVRFARSGLPGFEYEADQQCDWNRLTFRLQMTTETEWHFRASRIWFRKEYWKASTSRILYDRDGL